MNTRQVRHWVGRFGREYTDRNRRSIAETEALFRGRYGRGKRELALECLQGVDRRAPVLEVGCNLGLQLAFLRDLGFADLCGVEIQRYAIERAREADPGLRLVQASAFHLPFADESFELVFTATVLVHVHPHDLPAVLREICRVSRRHVWGYEFFAETCTEVLYRGHAEQLWKDDFAARYREAFPAFGAVRELRLNRLDAPGLVDALFLLEKGRRR